MGCRDVFEAHCGDGGHEAPAHAQNCPEDAYVHFFRGFSHLQMLGVAARKTPSRIRTEPGQALDGTSCEVQTCTSTNNTVGELSPEELSVADCSAELATLKGRMQ